MEPTGNRVEIQLIDMFSFNDCGLAQENWGVMDTLAMMQHLGVVPAGPPA